MDGRVGGGQQPGGGAGGGDGPPGEAARGLDTGAVLGCRWAADMFPAAQL
jgi:hypothetical protein